MTDAALDLQAGALLLAVTQQEGDLPRALARLCARVAPDDLTGPDFERALARAVEALFASGGERASDPVEARRDG